MDKEPITLNGLNKLKEELIFLKEKKRPKIVAAISEARSHGDLKENAEYHAAKEEQSHNEGRITEINDIIARANVIDVTKLKNDGKVIFGSTVFLEEIISKILVQVLKIFRLIKKWIRFLKQLNKTLPLVKFGMLVFLLKILIV